MQIVIFFLMALLGIIESWMQPWVSIAGIVLPVAFIGLVIVQTRVNVAILPWLGLVAGLVLDLGGAHYFGSNTLFFMLTGWAMTFNVPRKLPYNTIWLRIWVVAAAALLQPWYLLLVHRQFEVDVTSVAWIGIVRAVLVIVISLLYGWIFMRKEIEHT